jgi:hypothetical protein
MAPVDGQLTIRHLRRIEIERSTRIPANLRVQARICLMCGFWQISVPRPSNMIDIVDLLGVSPIHLVRVVHASVAEARVPPDTCYFICGIELFGDRYMGCAPRQGSREVVCCLRKHSLTAWIYFHDGPGNAE